MKKRIIAAFLALALLLSFSCFVSAETSGKETSEDITEYATSRALKKISELTVLLMDSYFTTTGTPCNNNSCDKCKNTNVLSCQWFSDMFGYTVSNNMLKGHYNANGTLSAAVGWSCYGFANFAYWYIFAPSVTSKAPDINRVSLPKGAKFNYSTLSEYALPGDIIRISGNKSSKHSVIFISCDASGVTVLDCNYSDSNLVDCHKIPYTAHYGGKTISNCSIAITRSSNYFTVKTETTAKYLELQILPSIIVYDGITVPTSHIAGNSFALKGTVVSTAILGSVTLEVVDASTNNAVKTVSVVPNSGYLDISHSELNTETKFAELPVGTYYLRYIAYDTSGTEKEWVSLNFGVVSDGHQCKYSKEDLGDNVSLLTCNICGAQMYVETDAVIDEGDDEYEDESEEQNPVLSESGIGDLDMDGTVTADDAIYMLYHYFFPDTYPVEWSCDFDKNGEENSDDAIYLLYHVFYPADFPI